MDGLRLRLRLGCASKLNASPSSARLAASEFQCKSNTQINEAVLTQPRNTVITHLLVNDLIQNLVIAAMIGRGIKDVFQLF